LVLREYEGLSCEEIGDILGMSRSAVKSVLFRGREEFRKLYVSADGEVG
jgi:RNA polymerase sigma-70 factor (ECF subfamily)